MNSVTYLVKTKFYTFQQNNSGGSHHIDSDVDSTVIIEAINATEANRKAQDIGIYFDGCYNGRDCSCCGDRWYEVDDCDGTDEPLWYSTPIREAKVPCILYKYDGTRIYIGRTESGRNED